MNLRTAQARLKKIADKMNASELPNEADREFLINAFYEIFNGQDANAALGVKAKRGERKGQHSRDTKKKFEIFYPWLAVATKKEKDGGLGLTDKNAVELIAKQFPFIEAETIARYWRSVKDNQREVFQIKAD